MSRPNRLATLLRVRELQERRASGGLARAERALAESRARVAERRYTLDTWSMASPLVTPLQLRAVQLQGRHAYELLVAAQADAHAQQSARDEAAAAASQAAVRRKSTERLVERRDVEVAAHARAAADRAMDELVVLRRPS